MAKAHRTAFNFDISNGKWCPYAATSNKQIDDAFWAGEQSAKIQNGRRKYSIQFGTMMQVNTSIGTTTVIDWAVDVLFNPIKYSTRRPMRKLEIAGLS